MTDDATQLQEAFASLDGVPERKQLLLRPILIQAVQDPELMRTLGTHALSHHLAALGTLLYQIPRDGLGPTLPPLRTFEHHRIGEYLDDAEEAYDFVQTLDSPLREHVEGGLSRALRNPELRTLGERTSLAALARLLAIAFRDLPFVAHVLSGGPIEPFLPPPSSASTPPLRPVAKRARATHKEPADAIPYLSGFLGFMVELTAVVPSENTSHLFLMLGKVVEVSVNHLVVESVGPDGDLTVVGLAHVIAMRKVSVAHDRPHGAI